MLRAGRWPSPSIRFQQAARYSSVVLHVSSSPISCGSLGSQIPDLSPMEERKAPMNGISPRALGTDRYVRLRKSCVVGWIEHQTDFAQPIPDPNDFLEGSCILGIPSTR